MSHPEGFAPESALEDLGLLQEGPGMEVVQLLGLGAWQYQVLREPAVRLAGSMVPLGFYLASGSSVPVGIFQGEGGGTGAWIIGALTVPDIQGCQQQSSPVVWNH